MNLPKSVAVKLTAGLLSAAMMISPALAASGVVTADSGLHVRQSSSADSASLGLLDKGTTVDILSDLGMAGWRSPIRHPRAMWPATTSSPPPSPAR